MRSSQKPPFLGRGPPILDPAWEEDPPAPELTELFKWFFLNVFNFFSLSVSQFFRLPTLIFPLTFCSAPCQKVQGRGHNHLLFRAHHSSKQRWVPTKILHFISYLTGRIGLPSAIWGTRGTNMRTLKSCHINLWWVILNGQHYRETLKGAESPWIVKRAVAWHSRAKISHLESDQLHVLIAHNNNKEGFIHLYIFWFSIDPPDY